MNGSARPNVPGYPGYGEPTFQRWPRRGDDQGRFEKTLLIAPGGALTGDTTVPFTIRTPLGVKCVVRVVVFVDIPDTVTDDPMTTNFTEQYAGGARLWLCSRPDVVHGRSRRFPTRQIVPQRGAGLLIPTSPDLWGIEVITQTLGDEIYGELTVNALEGEGEAAVANAPDEGVNWCARVDYESAEPCSAQEWAKVTQRAGLTATAKRMA